MGLASSWTDTLIQALSIRPPRRIQAFHSNGRGSRKSGSPLPISAFSSVHRLKMQQNVEDLVPNAMRLEPCRVACMNCSDQCSTSIQEAFTSKLSMPGGQ